MRKIRFFLILSFICVLALAACGLVACKNAPAEIDATEGRVTPVATAMNTVYGAMVASDGSGKVNNFTLQFSGTYTQGEKNYDFNFGGAFDITKTNREDDKRTQLFFEVKQGGVEVFLLYFFEGELYIDFPPYARRAKIADYNLADVAYAVYSEKENGVIKTVAETIPALASRIFESCRYYSESGTDRYVFTLSYADLFAALASFVNSWDMGVSPAELLAALHLDEKGIAALTAQTAVTTVEFSLKDGVFLSAKAETEGKGGIVLNTFSLTAGTGVLELPSALSSFTEFDFRNFALSGTVTLATDTAYSSKNLNYGLLLDRDFDTVAYPFTYEFKSHYVAGSGLEFDLSLTDLNGKSSRFAIRGEYLFADLSAYGVQKLKIKTDELSDRLSVTGFRSVGAYTFRDEMRLISLLLAGRNKSGDLVTYDLGSDFFTLLSKKLNFKGIFGVTGLSLGWNTANDRLQDLSAKLSFGSMSLSLKASSFTFGTPIALPDVDGDSYTDLAARETTHLSAKGTLAEHTAFADAGDMISALISSLSGEKITFAADGTVGFTSDLVYGADGTLIRFSSRLFTARGTEIVTLYYTADDHRDDPNDPTDDEVLYDPSETFYLIYPEKQGVRQVRALTLVADPLAAFNAALGASDSSVGNKILLASKENSFTIGVQSPMVSFIGEKLGLIYPKLDLSLLSALTFRRYELKITEDKLIGKVVFDSDNDLQITATDFAVTFNDDVCVAEINPVNVPERVLLLADNDMPTAARVTFQGDPSVYTLSLSDVAWTYSDVPTRVGANGQISKVKASIGILGKRYETEIEVDTSPAVASVLLGGGVYAEKYDLRTFTFNLYNDVAPQKVLDAFAYLRITVASGEEYDKKVRWDLSRFSISAFYSDTAQQRDFSVKPLVKTYFNTEIDLGSVSSVSEFTIHVNGDKAVQAVDPKDTSKTYSLTFVAYDGRDPTSPSFYGDYISVKTTAGEIVTVDDIGWNLDRITEIKQNNGNKLYDYATINKEKPDTVKVKVRDFTGHEEEYPVSVFFEKRVINSVSFESLPEGVSFDVKKQKFTFNVLKVRGLSLSDTDKALPFSMIANQGQSSEFRVMGIKWEFDPVENVANDSGLTGSLSFKIGDSISGYQTKDHLTYEFTKAEITKTALLAEDGSVISEKQQNIFRYEFANVSAYSDLFPAKARVTIAGGQETLDVDWLIEKATLDAASKGKATLSERIENAVWTTVTGAVKQELWNGGTYRLTGALGSQTLVVLLEFKQQNIVAYRYAETVAGTPVTRSLSGKDIPIVVKEGKSCLAFSVLGAMAGGMGADYNRVSDYPAEIEVSFNGTDYTKTSVKWDISAIKDKVDMIGIGGMVRLTVDAKGQQLDVYVYVGPAVGKGDVVYVDEDATQTVIKFRVMTPSEGGFVVTDPRKVDNYPKKLYINSSENLVNVVSWSGIDEGVVPLFNQGIAANKVKGSVVVNARIGSDTVGYRDIPVTVAIIESLVSDITVSGLPFAAGSDQTGGTTPYAITQNYVAGRIDEDAFGYEFSLDINPYYVNPKSSASYPTFVNFKLEGVDVSAKATWDLTRIPSNAAVLDTKTYPAYAMIDLTDAFPNLLIPVAVNVLKREIDKIWIRDLRDPTKYSSQPYIDIDSYSAAPFGYDVEDDQVTMDVKVQFKGDPNRYPLKLRYSKAGILLSYDGSGLYEDITVEVGNENGGYQAIGGYGIRVLSNIVSKIVISEEDRLADTDGVFFYVKPAAVGSDKLIYAEPKLVLDMGRDLPESISVVFGLFDDDSEAVARTIYLVGSEGAKGAGVVFNWVRDKDGALGITLWNPALDEATRGVDQTIYNAEQNGYNELKQTASWIAMFFDDKAWVETYRDLSDGYITVASSIERYVEQIKTDKVEKVNQRYFVTADDEDPNVIPDKIGNNTRLNVGTYRLYVDVVDHSYYKGAVYKTFRIEKKEINDLVVFRVNGGARTDDASAKYTGNDFGVTADVGEYTIWIPLLVNGVAEYLVRDVNYRSNTSKVMAYTFTVTVDENSAEYPLARNYVVNDVSFRFTVTESEFTQAQKESIGISQSWKNGTFTDLRVYMDGYDNILPDSELVNGYAITYYLFDEELNAAIPGAVSSFEAGKLYQYELKIKLPNYAEATKYGKVSAK